MTAVICVLLLLIIGLSYAWLSLTLQGKKTHVLRVAGLEITLDESQGEGISIEKAIPVTDEQGMQAVGYTFTIKNDGLYNSDYQIYLDDLELDEADTKLEDKYIKYQLIKNDEEVGLALLNTTGENPNRLLNEGTIAKGTTDTYILKLWLDINAPNTIGGHVFKGQIRVEAIQSTEKTAVSTLVTKVNQENTNFQTATSEQQKEMWTFSHTAGVQQVEWTENELKDYRYIGKAPNNYIRFNNEVWRIIGIFTVEDNSGRRQQRLKIMRNAFLSTSISFGTDNNWSTSNLQTILNGDYYNRVGSYKSTGLSVEAQDLIDEVKWYLGSIETNNSSKVPVWLYEAERGTDVYKNNNTNWVGRVGLIYPSDYGYATSGGKTISQLVCLRESLSNWLQNDCSTNDWIYKSTNSQWTLAPRDSDSNKWWYINSNGALNIALSSETYSVRPVVYLKPSVKIMEGTGTSTDPYQVSL